MSKKRRVVTRKGIGTTHTYHGPGRKKRPGVVIRFLQKIPSWGWWIGGAAIVAGYIWFFYYFFVGPFGFRWRALYGDVSYPEGYEIHGIDISHHQGRIDWDKLKDEGVVELDEERKAAMVSNLMVVLCADESAQPVVNTGSLY